MFNRATFTRAGSKGIIHALVEGWKSPRLMIRINRQDSLVPGEFLRCTMIDGGIQLRQVFQVVNVSGDMVQCWLTDSHMSTSQEREPRVGVYGMLVDVTAGSDRFSGKLTNVSRSGIAFAAFDRIPVGSRISVRLVETGIQVALNCKVVRAKQAPESDVIEYGVILEANGRVVSDLWVNYLHELASEGKVA